MKSDVICGVLGFASAFTPVTAFVYPRSSPGVVHLPIVKNRDAEARQLRKRSSGVVPVQLQNAEFLYYANVTVGTPPQSLSLQIDTGSSDTWVPWVKNPICQSQTPCTEGTFDPDASSTYKTVGSGTFVISYVDETGTNGDYFEDTVTIGGSTIKGLQVGLGVNGTINSGLLGISYSIDEGSVDANGNGVYPTIVDAMVTSGLINSNAYSLWLDDLNATTGNVLFGGIDTTKYEGELTNIPIYPDNSGVFRDMTVALTSVGVTSPSGHDTLTPSGYAIAAILDSGTSLTILPDDLAAAIFSELGAITDPNYGVVVPCKVGQVAGTIEYQFEGSNGPTIKVPISELILQLFDAQGNVPTFKSGLAACQLGIQAAGSRPVLLGDTFLRSAYVVYDLANNRIGIAPTDFSASSGTGNVVAFASSAAAIPSASTVAAGPSVTNTATDAGSPQGAYTQQVSATGVPAAGTSAQATNTFGAAAGFVTFASTSASPTGKKNAGGRLESSLALVILAAGLLIIL